MRNDCRRWPVKQSPADSADDIEALSIPIFLAIRPNF
jgi:hypothetical protein